MASPKKTFLQSKVGEVFKRIHEAEEVIRNNPLDDKKQKENLRVITTFKKNISNNFQYVYAARELARCINNLEFDSNVKGKILGAYKALVPSDASDLEATYKCQIGMQKEENVKKTLEKLSGSIINLTKFLAVGDLLLPDQLKAYKVHKEFEELKQDTKYKVKEHPSQLNTTIKAHGVTVTMQGDQISIPGKFSWLSQEYKNDIAKAAALTAAEKGWKEVTIHMENYQNRPNDARTFIAALVKQGFLLGNIYIYNPQKAKPKVKVQDAKIRNGEPLLNKDQKKRFQEVGKNKDNEDRNNLRNLNFRDSEDNPIKERNTELNYPSKLKPESSSFAQILSRLVGHSSENTQKSKRQPPVRNASDYVSHHRKPDSNPDISPASSSDNTPAGPSENDQQPEQPKQLKEPDISSLQAFI